LIGFAETAIIAIFSSAAAEMLLRERVIERLDQRGLRERAGSPRKHVFNDLLPVRLLRLTSRSLTPSDVRMFRAYFVAWLLSKVLLAALLIAHVAWRYGSAPGIAS
jgi:hypothetical protein